MPFPYRKKKRFFVWKKNQNIFCAKIKFSRGCKNCRSVVVSIVVPFFFSSIFFFYNPITETPLGKTIWSWNHLCVIIQFREAKFKRAPRVHFLTHFTKNFYRFLTLKVKSGTDMINPWIESSNFLFWYKKNLESDFWKFCGKQTKYISRVQI